MSYINPMFRALVEAPQMKPGIRAAWIMFRASYCYSRGHGLTRKESLSGAVPMLSYLWRA